SRGIRNAWHFYYALILVIKVVCGGFLYCVAHPLAGRYNHGIKWSIYDSKGMESYLSEGA
ncbi:hypothetical protein, partial [Vibrio parahaemolyticus]|uniref:hypothetical protein n=1 Tax=Vibrio parahaemolyticus TaxID=670 RepID=UPI00235FA87C